MTFLLIFSLITLIIAFLDSKKDFFSPSVLLTFGYSVSFCFGIYYAHHINYQIGIQTIAIYVISIIAFVGTEFFLRAFVLKKKHKKIVCKKYYYSLPTIVKLVSTIVCLFALFLVLREVKRIAGLNVSGNGNFIYDYKTNQLKNDLAGNDFNGMVVQVEKFMKAFAYIEMYLFINNMFIGKHMFFKKFIRNFYLLIPTIILFVDYWIRGNRSPIVIYFLSVSFMVYFLHLRNAKLGRKTKTKIGFGVVFVSLTIVFLFWAMRAMFGRSGKNVSIMDYLGNYFGGGPILMDMFLKDKAVLSNGYIEVFSGLATSFNKLGFSIKTTTNPEFRIFPGVNEVGNAYSGLRRFYHDGGIAGCIFFSALTSTILNVWVNKLKPSNNIRSIFSIIIYASLCHVPLLQFFDDLLICKFNVGLVIEYVIYYFIFKFVLYFSLRKDVQIPQSQHQKLSRSY